MSLPNNSKNTNRSTDTEPGDRWSLRIATVSGIPIRLNILFVLLLGYLAVTGRNGLAQVGFLLGVFFCVVLHELGHSLVAQRLGYTVRDIILYPIGGVASIEETPRARHELLIAVAGPAVNVVISAVLALVITLFTKASVGERLQDLFAQLTSGHGVSVATSYLTLLLYSNLMLVLFNMIPAFPMDGGRVLRAALALKIGRTKATRVAATVGQGLAIVLGLIGLGVFGKGGGNFILVIVAAFVFFAAGQERGAEESRVAMDDTIVGEAMMSDFVTLAHGDTLKHAADVLLAGSQQDFPVKAGEDVVGILSRSQLLRGLARDGDSAYVATFMDRNVVFASPDDALEDYLVSADGLRRTPVLVREGGDDGKIVGMVTMENAMEYLTLRRITQMRSGEVEDPA